MSVRARRTDGVYRNGRASVANIFRPVMQDEARHTLNLLAGTTLAENLLRADTGKPAAGGILFITAEEMRHLIFCHTLISIKAEHIYWRQYVEYWHRI